MQHSVHNRHQSEQRQIRRSSPFRESNTHGLSRYRLQDQRRSRLTYLANRAQSSSESIRMMLLEYNYKNKPPNELPTEAVLKEYISRDRCFESNTFVKLFESFVSELQKKLEKTRRHLRKLLSENANIHELQHFESNVLDILKTANKSSKTIKAFSEEHGSLQSQVCIDGLEQMKNKCRCLKKVYGLCKAIQELFESSSLTEARVDLFSRWMKVELRRLFNGAEFADINYLQEVERLLLDRFQQARKQQMMVRDHMPKARNTLSIISEVIQDLHCHENRIDRFKPLSEVKSNIETLERFVHSYKETEQNSGILSGLVALTTQAKERIPQVSKIIRTAIALTKERVIEQVKWYLQLSNIEKPTRYTNEFIQLLKFIAGLAIKKSDFDVWILSASIEQDLHYIEHLESYEAMKQESKRNLLHLLKSPIAMDSFSSCRSTCLIKQFSKISSRIDRSNPSLAQLDEQYKRFMNLSNKLIEQLGQTSGEGLDTLQNRQQILSLISMSSSLLLLSRKKVVTACLAYCRRPSRIVVKPQFSKIVEDVRQIIALKKDISKISETLGGGLQITYDNSFIHHIEAVNELLKEYVWTSGRTRFEPQRLEQLVDEIGRDKWGLGADSQWLALYWNIACLLVEEIPFVDLPKNIAGMDEVEYERFCLALESNDILFKQANELVSRVEKSGSKIAASLSKRISGFPAHYEQLKRIHSALELIERQQQRLRGEEFARDLDSKLDLLFEYAFTSQGENEISTVLKSITEMCITIRDSALSLSTADDQQCLLVHRRTSNLVEPLTHCIELAAAAGLEGIEDTSELYDRLAHLRSAILQTVGAGDNPHHFEAVAPELEERLVVHLQKRVQACVQNFVFSKPALPTQLTVKSKQQALRMRRDLEETVAIMGSIGAPMAEQIALQVSQRIFGAEQTNDNSLSSYGDRVAEAKKKVDSLGPLLEAFHQLRNLSATLGQLSGLVESLTGSSIGLEEQCQKINKMTQMFRTRGADGWWTVRCRNHDLPEEALFYGQSQTAVQTFLKGLIHKVAPELSNADLATVFQSMVSITGQTCEIISIAQFSPTSNTLLYQRLFHNSSGNILERQLHSIYKAMWMSYIFRKTDTSIHKFVDEFSQLVELGLKDQLRAQQQLREEGHVINRKSGVEERIKKLQTDVIAFRKYLLPESSIELKDIHQFSCAIKELSCIDFSKYREFKDLESQKTYLMYLEDSSLKQFIDTCFIALIHPDKREEFEQNISQMDSWKAKVLSLSSTPSNAILEQLIHRYGIQQIITKRISKTHSIQQLIKILVASVYQNQNIPCGEELVSISDCIESIGEIQRILVEQLQAQNPQTFRGLPWLEQLFVSMKKTLDHTEVLYSWITKAYALAMKNKAPLEEIQNLAMALSMLLPMLGLEGQLGFLLDSQSRKLGVFLTSPEDFFFPARILFRKHYTGELKFTDEVLIEAMRVQNNDVILVPYCFKLCFLADGKLMQEGNHIKIFLKESLVASIDERQCSVNINLPIDQVALIRFELFNQENELVKADDEKQLQGNRITFSKLTCHLENEIRQEDENEAKAQNSDHDLKEQGQLLVSPADTQHTTPVQSDIQSKVNPTLPKAESED